jgi:hypothetical protein
MHEFPERIEAALNVHPLSEKILRFLAEHEGAMDTIQGIARCWVDSDEVAVQPVLEGLVSAGLIVGNTVRSGTYYCLTPNPRVRKQLKVRFARRSCQ